MRIVAGAHRRWAVSSVLLLAMLASSTVGFPIRPALALSELKPLPGQTSESPAKDETPPAPSVDESTEDGPDAVIGLPEPAPLIDNQPAATPDASAAEEPPAAPVEVIYDIEKAPEPIRRLRQLMVEAAASGDLERLRPLMNPGPNQTQVVLGDNDTDPVELLKSLSGDPDGLEVLAILLDVLSTGFVRVDAGTPDEVYVWPYFAEKPLGTLTAPEKVELLRIVTAGDYDGMLEYGNYNFFRAGISPDGQWKFFTAGD